MNEDKSELRNEMILNSPVESIILKLAVPTIISMLITSIYNMADTFFVSQIGTSASGAIGIVFSAMMMIQAIAFTIGMGAGNNIARFLGSGNMDMAKKYCSVSWFTGFAVGCIIAVIGLVYMHDIVMILGSTETIAVYAEEYAKYIFIASPFMMCSIIMNTSLRFQGLAFYAMCGIMTGGILNIILDPVFIFAMDMGTSGAGLATGISQFISFCILLFMCGTREEAISIRFKDFKPSKKIYISIIYTGIPSMARQGISSISTAILNAAAGSYGDAAIAALSIVSRFTMFINSVVVGFGQGFQPVCSFNFGAGKYDRVRKAFWFCVKVSTCVLLVLCIVSMFLSNNIIVFFRKDDIEVIEIGTFALRAHLCAMPLWGYYTISNMFSQSIGYGFRASLIACARQGLFLIPVLFILPYFFGITGLQIAQPVSDVLAFILAFILVNNIFKEIKKR